MRWMVLLIAVSLTGCLTDDADGGDGGDDTDTTPISQTVTLSETGTLSAGAQAPAGMPCTTAGEEGVDIAHHEWEIPAQVNGTPVKMRGMVVTLQLGTTAADQDLYVYDPSGTLAGSSADFNYQTGTDTEQVQIAAGPTGTWTIEVQNCLGANAQYTLSGTAEIYS